MAIIEQATWKLPEGHRSESCHADQQSAAQAAHFVHLRIGDPSRAVYLSDKRGAWEVISYPVTPPTSTNPLD